MRALACLVSGGTPKACSPDPACNASHAFSGLLRHILGRRDQGRRERESVCLADWAGHWHVSHMQRMSTACREQLPMQAGVVPRLLVPHTLLSGWAERSSLGALCFARDERRVPCNAPLILHWSVWQNISPGSSLDCAQSCQLPPTPVPMVSIPTLASPHLLCTSWLCTGCKGALSLPLRAPAKSHDCPPPAKSSVTLPTVQQQHPAESVEPVPACRTSGSAWPQACRRGIRARAWMNSSNRSASGVRPCSRPHRMALQVGACALQAPGG